METFTHLSSADGIDTKELRQLAKDFKDWKPDKQLHKMLRVAGALIADDARSLVAPQSKSVPPTIKVAVRGTRLSVSAGGVVGAAGVARTVFAAGYGTPEADRALKAAEGATHGVALAGLLEMGNRGKKSAAASRRGEFRHPVFGNRSVWVSQKRESYLLPAAEKNTRRIEQLEGRAVAEAFRERGFPVTE